MRCAKASAASTVSTVRSSTPPPSLSRAGIGNGRAEHGAQALSARQTVHRSCSTIGPAGPAPEFAGQVAELGVAELVQDRPAGGARDLGEVVLPVGVAATDLPERRHGRRREPGRGQGGGDRVRGPPAGVLARRPGEDRIASRGSVETPAQRRPRGCGPGPAGSRPAGAAGPPRRDGRQIRHVVDQRTLEHDVGAVVGKARRRRLTVAEGDSGRRPWPSRAASRIGPLKSMPVTVTARAQGAEQSLPAARRPRRRPPRVDERCDRLAPRDVGVPARVRARWRRRGNRSARPELTQAISRRDSAPRSAPRSSLAAMPRGCITRCRRAWCAGGARPWCAAGRCGSRSRRGRGRCRPESGPRSSRG